jgi:hypothetical protein
MRSTKINSMYKLAKKTMHMSSLIWNIFENKLINIKDTLIPETKFINKITCKQRLSSTMKNIINRRKRLLKKYKLNRTHEIKRE